jgi:exonuclease III
MRFGTWNVRSAYRLGSSTIVARQLGKYNLDLVGVQEVRWEKGGAERQRVVHFSTDRGMGIIG